MGTTQLSTCEAEDFFEFLNTHYMEPTLDSISKIQIEALLNKTKETKPEPKEKELKIRNLPRDMEWTENTISVFENTLKPTQSSNIWTKHREMLGCFAIENLHVSVKISWMKHSLKMSLSLQNLFTARKETTSKFLVEVLLPNFRYSQCLQTVWY